MKIKPFGLDIGARTMRALWLSENKGKFSLNAAITVPVPVKGMLSESPLDQEEMAHTIRQMVSDAKITQQFVNIALPENQVYVRIIDMPFLSEKELSSAIYWEAEQYIPLPLVDVTLDWKIMQKPENVKGGGKMQVLLVGAPTVLIDKYQKILSLAGLEINTIETEILSVVRVATFSNQQNKKEFPASIVVHIGDISTSIAIVKNGFIVFTYSIATGSIALDRAIATDFGFTMQQAEEYKRTYGLSKDALEGKIGQSTMPVLASILSEVKKALVFYKEKYANEEQIRQILLSGGTARLPGFDKFFAQYTEIESVVVDPVQILGLEQIPKELEDASPDYAVSFGLAMRDYE